MEKNLFQKKEVTITNYRTMADKSVRITVDCNELTKEEIGEIHGLMNEGLVSLILSSTKLMEEASDEGNN